MRSKWDLPEGAIGEGTLAASKRSGCSDVQLLEIVTISYLGLKSSFSVVLELSHGFYCNFGFRKAFLEFLDDSER